MLFPMPYRLLADLVLLAHAAFVGYVVLGGAFVPRWPRSAWLHLPVLAWGAGIELLGGICPLTPLEVHWRRLAGERGYPGGFVEHYVVPTLYPDGLTREAQLILGVLVLALNTLIYGGWLWHRRGRRASG